MHRLLSLSVLVAFPQQQTTITSMQRVVGFGLVLISLLGRSAAEPVRPNFVVIVSDDHAFRAIGYRNPQVSTPHLDDLAANGFRFDRFFVASPICVASRA